MNHVVIGINDLKSQRPDLLADWDYQMNDSIDPEQVSIGSEKKVWWKCENGHSYSLGVGQKVHGQGCPLCKGRYCVSGINDLVTMCPNLMDEWDYSANCSIDPHTLYYRSHTRVQWICKLGHTWTVSVSSRIEHNTGCPICAGNTVFPGFNDLLSGFPDIASEWNFEKNKPVLPSEVTRFSTKNVWWKCQRCGYEWRTSVKNRTHNKSGCPKCKKYSQTSFPEQAIFYYIAKVFPQAANKYRFNSSNVRFELDVFIPNINIGIEYDGKAWHQSDISISRDRKKYEYCRKKGIQLIRVSEFVLSPDEQACDTFIFRDTSIKNSLDKSIEELLHLLQVDRLAVNTTEDRDSIMSSYANTNRERSLAVCFPDIALQWNYKKNGTITPEKVNAYTQRYYWWKCNSGHEWRSTVSNRTSADCGCPYCSGKRLIKGENDLQTKYPEQAKWWDDEKNAPLHACDVKPGSVKKYWWFCDKGHSYQATPNSKTSQNTGCPVCSNLLIIPGINSLADTHPLYAAFWDYSKNSNIPISEIASCSTKRCFWVCSLGHTWEETPSKFTRRKPKCPICSGLQLLKGFNDLETTHPQLIQDWDYEKNNKLPSEYQAKSTAYVNWKCAKCGHLWKTQIRTRTLKGANCPVCCYRTTPANRIQTLLSNGRSLAERFPEIAKEWDYDGNNGMTPADVTFGSNMMASWICPKGHKYKAIVVDRTGKKKCGCSYCRYDKAKLTLQNKRAMKN